jgi:lysozyme family protein
VNTERAEQTFDAAMVLVDRNEGGFLSAADAAARGDPGGETNMGIIQRTLTDVRKRYPVLEHLPERVRDLRRADVELIYRVVYWEDRNIYTLSDDSAAVATMVLDAGIQHGPFRAVVWLQRLLGAREDGSVGPETRRKLGASASLGDLVMQYHDRRTDFVIEWANDDPKRAGSVVGLIRRVRRTERFSLTAGGLLAAREV